ncbi:MAG: hypothetical protein ACOH2H_18940 [Cypionkella sp.]
MFSNWQQEKATAALVDEAQALADKLSTTKPHFLDSHAAAAQFWAAVHLSNGVNLHEMAHWKPGAVVRFATTTATKIASLRKQREYASSDGLAIWLHTARAVTEPRIAPAVRDIWRQLSAAGPNVDTMVEDLLQDAGLPLDHSRAVPKGFQVED